MWIGGVTYSHLRRGYYVAFRFNFKQQNHRQCIVGGFVIETVKRIDAT